MSQENVEIVKAAYDAYNRGDVDAAPKDAAPDFELDWSRATGPQRGIFRLDQVRPFFYDQLLMAEVDLPLSQVYFSLFTVDGGKITRIVWFQSRAEALEAAGLSE